jgi:nucleotide-binding universal stress UspA family protein
MTERYPSHILCPVDFSDLSGAALNYSVRLASVCKADITVVHAYWFEAPLYFTPGQADGLKMQYRSAAGQMRAALEKFAASAGAPSAGIRLEEGDPARSVIRAGIETNTDLIVMGTHGRRGFEAFMLGSVAERVLRSSSVPVLTVRGRASSDKVGSILCPVNNTRESRSALQIAARLAVCCGAELTALHVEEDDDPTRIDDLCHWIAEEEQPNCTIGHLRSRGNPAEVILKRAAAGNADLLVIGAAHKAFFDSTFMGSTTVRVVRHATCPVLTVSGKVGEKLNDLSASVQKTAR